MAAIKKGSLPAHLRGKVSPSLVDFVTRPGNRMVVELVGFGGAVLVLWAAREPHPSAGYSALLYLLVPAVCPAIPALWYTFRPFKPYRGSPSSRIGRKPVDSSDPVVARLVELYRSADCRWVLWRATAMKACLLYGVSAAFMFMHRRSLDWDGSWDLWLPLAMGSLFCWVWMGGGYTAWGLRTWAEREMSREGHG